LAGVTEQSSLIFRAWLKILGLFRRPYLWARETWPQSFEKDTNSQLSLDTSRMLYRFNAFHRLFFSRGFGEIGFNEEDLKHLRDAYQKGPVVLLMRNWGQVEYNYFNDLFSQKKLPLVVHNNMVKVAHWMPWRVLWPTLRQKIDYFFVQGSWPYNNQIFDLAGTLGKKQPVLLCLDLPRGNPWVEKSLQAQSLTVQDLLEAQKKLPEPIQLVPLHFIYDKHPGKAKKSLMDILFGDREDPGYVRKVIFFLRNYKKRAVAKIGEPIALNAVAPQGETVPADRRSYLTLLKLQKTFDEESHQVTGPKLKSRRHFISEIIANRRFQEKLEEIAREEGIPLDAAMKKVGDHLKDIVSDINFTVIELWNYFLSWLFNRFYDGLMVDTKGIAKIKKVAKDSPLILVPSHKSHVDYMLLSYVFYHHDLTLPLVCAGNNLAFWPLGPVFRRSGGYFIPRTFSGNRLYALALKSYVEELMREGYFQEFFIEGTRSRSGKLFPPKLGLLSMIVESFMSGHLKDVHFVPISIDYERVIEQKSYLEEVEGGKKRKEKFTDLFRLPKFLKKSYGKVYIQFADPISLKERLKKNERPIQEFNQELALEICRGISRVGTLLPTALAATALLIPIKKSVTAKELEQKCDELKKIAGGYEPRLSESLQKDFHHAVQDALDQFTRDGLIQLHEGLGEKFFTIPAASRQTLNFFKNKGINFFAEPALKQLCKLKNRRGSGFPGSKLLEKTTELLDKEFFFPPGLKEQPGTPLPDWVADIARPFLESYRLSLHTIEHLNLKKMEEWLLVRKILEAGRLLKLKGTLEYPESLSRFNIQNAVQQFVKLGVLKTHEAEMGPAGRRYYSLGTDPGPRERTHKLLEVLLND
jgi:glycerol-3-phosphate O-acyltransferase